MHKVVKTSTYSFGNDEPVKIDNTVFIPSTEEEAVLSEAEIKERAAREKKEQERRFQEAVSAEATKIVEARRAELEQERVKIIERAKKKADDMAEDAKNTTAAVLDRTGRECMILKEKAKADGFKEGFDEGKRQSLEKCAKYVDAAAKLLTDINARKDAYYVSNEAELKETMFVMVEKIVKAELECNPEVVERIIADAAKGFRNSDYIKISLADGEVSRTLKTDEKLMKKIIPFINDIEVEILPDAEEGTVILDNDEEIVDASIPTQLDFLKEILKNTRGEGK